MDGYIDGWINGILSLGFVGVWGVVCMGFFLDLEILVRYLLFLV